MGPWWLLALASTLGAADLQVWNTTEFNLIRTRRWKVEGSGVIRSRDGGSSPYDSRLGSLVRYLVSPSVNIGFGYLRRWVDADRSRWLRQHRISVGPTLMLLTRPVAMESLTLVENHWTRIEPAFLRYRQRIEMEVRRRHWSPFLSSEIVFRNQHGVLRSRSLAGIRRRFPHDRKLELGYQFESVNTAGAWVPRHSIRTTISLGTIFGRQN